MKTTTKTKTGQKLNEFVTDQPRWRIQKKNEKDKPKHTKIITNLHKDKEELEEEGKKHENKKQQKKKKQKRRRRRKRSRRHTPLQKTTNKQTRKTPNNNKCRWHSV